MAKKKIYAVRKGKTTGIFESWNDCKNAIDGFSGAEYKGFSSLEEANEYLSDVKQDVLESLPDNERECLTDRIVAYVDGSFDEKIGK